MWGSVVKGTSPHVFCKFAFMEKIHRFNVDISAIELPAQFTYPFNYVPHELARIASAQVREYISSVKTLHDELVHGKMVGVLVVVDASDRLGFVSAYSGNLYCNEGREYFVPPVYDTLVPDGYFKVEEAKISEINGKIKNLEESAELMQLKAEKEALERVAEEALSAYRSFMKDSKLRRDAARLSGTGDEDAMLRESMFQKAEYKRIKKSWEIRIGEVAGKLEQFYAGIKELKNVRHSRSAALQDWLFHQFVMLNGKGDRLDLCEIFAPTSQHVPPAGAGECAAPRMLQYAYLHGLRPVTMAEFWFGRSPGDVIRRDGEFYPACRGKCLPILNFMLQGIDVEPDPLAGNIGVTDEKVHVLYEDDWLVVVDKPAGMLTVPGKTGGTSLLELVAGQLHLDQRHAAVHRLDMDTSGIVMFAKSADVCHKLQRMFECREISKCYEALLDGIAGDRGDNGYIDLPLSSDMLNRPFQKVDYENGKQAVTRYEILSVDEMRNETRVRFEPLTGRTHQLRVHAAHAAGLGHPIIGDNLYGKKGERLMLHAAMIDFIHPVTARRVHVESRVPF